MNYNNELLKLYLKWIKEVDDSFFDPSNNFSNPYLISAPENWSYSYKNRIMIIGKEGYGTWGAGKGDFDPFIREGILNIMQYNEDYVYAQTIARKKYKDYKYNRSAFWRRFRAIADLSNDTPIIWNNYDKFHHLAEKNCSLSEEERSLLHLTKTKILSEEIKILCPTHIIFFGVYWNSLTIELPELSRLNIDWEEKIAFVEIANTKIFFTNHPGWRGKYRPKNYEQNVVSEIKENLY